jgi:hypothetical protein
MTGDLAAHFAGNAGDCVHEGLRMIIVKWLVQASLGFRRKRREGF